MQKTVLTTIVLMTALPTLAFADNATSQAAGTPTQSNATTTQTTAAPDAMTAHANLRHQIMMNLQHAGFTNVAVVPDSFLVHAKDKSGNPVVMFINPDSVTEVSGMPATTSGTQANTQDQTQAKNQTGEGSEFPTVAQDSDVSSKIVGLDVYNKANQDIGTIKDIALDRNNVAAYIIGVGGFLGMNDRYVAVNPSDVAISYDSNAKKWHAEMDTNADQLKNAPQYKYSSNS